MSLEDLVIDIGFRINDSDINDAIGSLKALDHTADDVDPISIDVDVTGETQALSEISTVATAAEAADDTVDIDVDVGDMGELTIPDDSDVNIGVTKEDTGEFVFPDDDSIDIGVDVNGVESTLAELARVDNYVRTLDGKTIDIGIDIDDEFDIGMPDGGDTDSDSDISTEVIQQIIDGSFNIPDGGVADGGDGETDGSGETRDSRFDRLEIPQVVSIVDLLGDQLDPRGLLREDLTVEELRTGDMDDPIFVPPREMDADRLFPGDRESQGVETLIDWNEVFRSIDEDGLESLFEVGGGFDFGDDLDLSRFRSFPEDPEIDRGVFSLDEIKNFVLGDKDPFTGKRGGFFGMFDDINMSQFHNAIAKLIPLLLIFVGALPAAITAIGALAIAAIGAAAGLAAIGGLALLGGALILGEGDIAGGLKELISIIKDQFLSAFVPLARRFDDLFFDALNGLGEFFDALAANGRVLVQLKDEARALGGFIMDFAPSALRLLVQMGDAFSPLFAMFGEWMAMNFDNILRGMTDVFRRLLPSIMALVDAFLRLLPVLIDFSIGFFVAAAVILQIISAVLGLLNALGPLGTALALITGLVFGLASISSMLYLIYSGLSMLFAGSALSAVYSYVAGLWAAFAAEHALAAGAITAAIAVGVLIGFLTFGLVPLLVGLGSVFGVLSSDIDKATQSLDQFSEARGQFGDIGGGHTGGLSRGSVSIYEDNSNTTYNSAGEDRAKQRREHKRNGYRERLFAPY